MHNAGSGTGCSDPRGPWRRATACLADTRAQSFLGVMAPLASAATRALWGFDRNPCPSHAGSARAGCHRLYLFGLQANQRKIVMAARAEDVTRPNP